MIGAEKRHDAIGTAGAMPLPLVAHPEEWLMRLTRSPLPLATVLLTLGLPISNGETQEVRRIVVTPYAGVFMPAAKIADFKAQVGGVQSRPGIQQQTSLALGLNASFWLNDLAALELGGAWAFSDARESLGLSGQVPGLSLSGNESARVIMGSAKLMLNLIPLTSRTALRLGVGPAIISRGGSAYRADESGEFSGLTDFGGTISLCTRLPLTDFMSLRVRAENYMYSSKLRFRDFDNPTEEFTFSSKLQNDFIFSAGLQMVFWR